MWSISLVPFGLKCIWLYTVSRRLAVIDIACDMNTSYTFESSPIWFSFPQFHWLEDLGLRVCHDFLVISTSLPPSLQKKKKICTHKCPLRNRGVFVDLEWCVQLLRTRCTGQHHSILPMIPAARSQMPWQALWYLRERYEALAWELITWRPDIQTRLENQEEELFFVVSMMKAMLLDLFLSVALKGRCCLSVIVTYNSRYHA